MTCRTEAMSLVLRAVVLLLLQLLQQPGSVQCAVCSVHVEVCSVHSAVCSVQCAVSSVQAAVSGVQCAVWYLAVTGVLYHQIVKGSQPGRDLVPNNSL